MMKRVKELSGAVAAITLLAAGAFAQGGAVAAARPQQAVIKDSTGRVLVIRGTSPLIDSLIRKFNNLPVGSPEYFATDSAINAAISELPRPTVSGTLYGEFRIEVSRPNAALTISPSDVVPQGTLGFTADAYNRRWYTPFGQYLQYFEYPTVVAIEANSPASRAGVKSGDSVLAYNGLDLRRQAINLTQLLTPGREVSVRLRRDGESRDVLVAVDKAPDRLLMERRVEATQFMAMASSAPSAPTAQNRRVFEEQVAVAAAAARGGSGALAPTRAPVAAGGFGGAGARATTLPAYATSPSGVLGAAMVNVDPDLAKSLRGMEGKQGVLVTFVPQGSLADRIVGLRSGDVILRVEASDVPTFAQLRVRLIDAEQNGHEKIKLLVLRAGKTIDLIYTPQR